MTTFSTNNIEIDTDIRSDKWQVVPELGGIVRTALLAAMSEYLTKPFSEISLVFTDDAHMLHLNQEYRGQKKSTNVLSFPAQSAAQAHIVPALGDIVLAFETIACEAEKRGISLTDHTAHLVIHGYLHLQGLDHQNDDEARTMETFEINALQHLGIPNPYVKDIL